ncbi:hypothetical protein H6F74_20340 [Trichocoleus sp. FACHB-90]|uniref:hypothetical protein n=1 Tax=Trichocoleus sp. FACHB-90 TaxID=2692876 RepID=UPI001682805B|nr:hypothetical protein [Trichocoleus sp. FACHB-90]MBD1928580.1 hypothetical protein [Trichocoleus sp. FACHB-90]
MGIGDWGLGIGDWELGIGRNLTQPLVPSPQSPAPSPQSLLLGRRKEILNFSSGLFRHKYRILNCKHRSNAIAYLTLVLTENTLGEIRLWMQWHFGNGTRIGSTITRG